LLIEKYTLRESVGWLRIGSLRISDELLLLRGITRLLLGRVLLGLLRLIVLKGMMVKRLLEAGGFKISRFKIYFIQSSLIRFNIVHPMSKARYGAFKIYTDEMGKYDETFLHRYTGNNSKICFTWVIGT
jgi:hypothetical protein